jgi:hypothetical protein
VTRLATAFVLGYHGCQTDVAQEVVNQKQKLWSSENQTDWLGRGIYFWEGDPQRALEWAEERVRRKDYKTAAVVGAVIDLGNCLDLTKRENLELLKDIYSLFVEQQKRAGLPIPVNQQSKNDPHGDRLKRYLDCAVITFLHELIRDGALNRSKVKPFDSVRGMFTEGGDLYPGAGFQAKSHSQIAVLEGNCIKGVFYPID